MKFLDSFVNLLSGLGGDKDKLTAQRFFYAPLSREQLEAAYRTDWIASKVVDIPAEDSTRMWRAWQASKPQVEKIEAVEKAFNVQNCVYLAMMRARLYGGAAIILGVEPDGMDQPLVVDRVGAGSLQFLHVEAKHNLAWG